MGMGVYSATFRPGYLVGCFSPKNFSRPLPDLIGRENFFWCSQSPTVAEGVMHVSVTIAPERIVGRHLRDSPFPEGKSSTRRKEKNPTGAGFSA
jgi:hypothetical protein